MSDAALTDSTTPKLENWRTVAPFSGSSTKTTSPSCSCAKCVIPIVATSPSARTHSCSLEYLRSSGMVLTAASYMRCRFATPSYVSGSFRAPTVKRRLHYRSGNLFSADADGETGPDLRERRRDIREGDVLLHGRPERAARDLSDDLAAGDHLVPVPRDAALDHESRDTPAWSALFRRGDRVASEELLVELARPAEPGLDRVGRLVDVVAVEREARLEPQRVACPEADRLRPRGEEQFPDRRGVVVREE